MNILICGICKNYKKFVVTIVKLILGIYLLYLVYFIYYIQFRREGFRVSSLCFKFFIEMIILAFMEIENPDRFEPTHAINECNELFAYFATKCLESLIKCTRQSLDILRKRASVSR